MADDTFHALAETYGGSPNTDSGAPINLGTEFYWPIAGATGTGIRVSGVRFWRTTQSQSTAPSVHIAKSTGTGASSTAERSKTSPSSGSVAAGWETLLFDTPYDITDHDNYCVWVYLPNQGYCATAAKWTNPQLSQQGLMGLDSGTGPQYLYSPATPATRPVNDGAVGTSYWVEPLTNAIPTGGGPYTETGRQISITATVAGVGEAFEVDNPIPAENALTGYAPANWQISGVGDTGALGYTTTMSVAAGSSIDFKIHTGGSGYSLEIVRLGWYNNNGARLVHTFSGRPGVTQPASVQGGAGTGEAGTGSHSCTSWTVTDTWSVPSGACHGVYLGVIKRSGGSASHVGPFIVTTAHSAVAEIMCKLSDFTWHAYNSMGTLADPTGGKSLYGVGAGAFAENQRAWSQSYDAPLTYAGGAPQTSYWNGEQPLHTWLERNGYDVAYTSCLDVDADPDLLLGHKVVISEGHDEYWSQNIRDAWDAAIDAGVNAIVASGNTMLWRVRMVGRTMWCYKDTHSLNGVGAGHDPGDEWTGCWRDTRWANRRPENESLGTMFVKNGLTSVAMIVPDTYKTEPLWRGTTVASLGTGTSETLKTHSPRLRMGQLRAVLHRLDGLPAWLETAVAHSDGSDHQRLPPERCPVRHDDQPGQPLHRRLQTRHVDGRQPWCQPMGLRTLRLPHLPLGRWRRLGENTTMKQATVNLLADMGCQPGTITVGLSAATLTAWTFPTLTSGLSIPATLSIAEGDISAVDLGIGDVVQRNDFRPAPVRHLDLDQRSRRHCLVQRRGHRCRWRNGNDHRHLRSGVRHLCCHRHRRRRLRPCVDGGSDPTSSVDGLNYELGTWFTVSKTRTRRHPYLEPRPDGPWAHRHAVAGNQRRFSQVPPPGPSSDHRPSRPDDLWVVRAPLLHAIHGARHRPAIRRQLLRQR